MNDMLSLLVKRFEDRALSAASVIPWSCPVPSFGDPSTSTVATLGLNPSKREFVDALGNELSGHSRRLHTLNSLRLDRWSRASESHIGLIADACRKYFSRNPYDGWFRSLDYLIGGSGASYYSQGEANACHLDLIPYATACKWTELASKHRSSLLALAGDTLGLLLQDTPIEVIVLNGQAVVDNLQSLTQTEFKRQRMTRWTLPRHSCPGVSGFAYSGVVKYIGGIRLNTPVTILGFNHNIQSSFGVTTKVKQAIRRWLTDRIGEVVQ